jgi:ATP synthase protein I
MSEPQPNHEAREAMQRAVRNRETRREAWSKSGERPLWKNLSMVGSLGWLIVTPTLAGVFLGRWIDGLLDTRVTFSGGLTFLGACLGFYLAWRRMNEE